VTEPRYLLDPAILGVRLVDLTRLFA
jgi:hypothetical protein